MTKPLFILMGEAFDGAMHDDCFYEWNEVAAAMLRAIADRIVETSLSEHWGSDDLAVAYWLQEEADLAIKAEKDPRNDQDYCTWSVGLEPIPGDTTWGEK
jgi:hypothetical protein